VIGKIIGSNLSRSLFLAEIQYLDYLLYCIQIMSDDLACKQFYLLLFDY